MASASEFEMFKKLANPRKIKTPTQKNFMASAKIPSPAGLPQPAVSVFQQAVQNKYSSKKSTLSPAADPSTFHRYDADADADSKTGRSRVKSTTKSKFIFPLSNSKEQNQEKEKEKEPEPEPEPEPEVQPEEQERWDKTVEPEHDRGGGRSDDQKYEHRKSVVEATLHHEINSEKQGYLLELIKFKKQGIELTRSYTMDDTLDDIQFEFDRIRTHLQTVNNVGMISDGLMFVFQGLEFANNQFGSTPAQVTI